MREEIEAAVHFVGRVIISSYDTTISFFTEFKNELSKVMEERFKGHWHDDSPGKGQGYRSIRIHPTEPLDPVLSLAAEQSKFSIDYLRIPVELTVWVDPKDVSCRFGDLKATYCTVLKDADNKASVLDVDELLESAKALYSRQQHFIITDGSQRTDLSLNGFKSELFFGMPMNGFADSYLFPPYAMYPMWQSDGVGDGSTTPPVPYSPSFTPSAVNTTPRKSGKNNHFRKGSNGTGRSSKHHQHHHHNHHHQNAEGGSFNHNHNNNNNSNANTPTPNSTPNANGNVGLDGYKPGDRFHWASGAMNHQSPYAHNPHHQHFNAMHQHRQPPPDTQQTPSKKRQNSESEKDKK